MTPFIAFYDAAISSNLKFIFTPGNAFPRRSWGINEYAICPAAPVTHTVNVLFIDDVI